MLVSRPEPVPSEGNMLRILLIAAFAAALPVSLVADTVVMRDGTRVRGELIAARNGIIEFEERGGIGRGRRLQLDVADVSRIEFEAVAAAGRDFAGGRPS